MQEESHTITPEDNDAYEDDFEVLQTFLLLIKKKKKVIQEIKIRE